MKWVEAACLEVLLADILIAQGGAASWPLSCGELSIPDVLGDAAIFHSAHVSEPVQASLGKDGKHAWHACLKQDVSS